MAQERFLESFKTVKTLIETNTSQEDYFFSVIILSKCYINLLEHIGLACF